MDKSTRNQEVDELENARQALEVLGIGSIPYSKALVPVARAIAVARKEGGNKMYSEWKEACAMQGQCRLAALVNK